ncbi:MAG: hypothetical protein ACJ79R_05210 [Anaeromyxobacteraceae bacterium]
MPSAPGGLDRLLPPQIKGDRFYRALRRVAATPGVRTILEIGASSGAGSTEALVAGALGNPEGPPQIHTIEVSKARFAVLAERYARYPFLHPYNTSSVPASAFPGDAEVARFYREVRSKLRNNRLEKVLGWLRQDLAYLAEHPELSAAGIERIRAAAGVETFDAVLIDGSEFTGSAELDLVHGARFILLDDTRSFKTWECQRRLRNDAAYRRVASGYFTRNGWAMFERARPPLDAPRKG